MTTWLQFFTIASLLVCGCSRADSRRAPVTDVLAKAMAANDLTAIRGAAAEGRMLLGDKAGIPEAADEFRSVPADATFLTQAEAQRGFTPHFAQLETQLLKPFSQQLLL